MKFHGVTTARLQLALAALCALSGTALGWATALLVALVVLARAGVRRRLDVVSIAGMNVPAGGTASAPLPALTPEVQNA
jgi:uncharacterized protein with beta-barrel porin domain